MSAPSWFVAGMLTGAAATLGVILWWRASHEAIHRRRKVLLVGGITAAAAVAFIAGMSLAAAFHQGAVNEPGEAVATDSPPQTMPPSGEMPAPPATSSTSGMPPAAVMSQILAMPSAARAQSAQPMDEAAAKLAARLERQGGTAADWNLLAQAYDFLGRPDDAQRARARAAELGAVQRAR